MPDGWSSLPLILVLVLVGIVLPTDSTTSGCPKVGPFPSRHLCQPRQVTLGCPQVDEAFREDEQPKGKRAEGSMSRSINRTFPAGHISVKEASALDETNGRNWTMPQANDVRFMAVRGTIMIDTPLYYQFTLVIYHMYIDTVPWTIFTTLDDALAKEFDPHFFYTLNCRRRERWGFSNVAWRSNAGDYDVDTPYSDVRLSIFDTYGRTRKVVKPFQYNYDFLRVHVNGAAVYAQNAELAFLLPLIVTTHRLLPAIPIFWNNEDGSIALHRSSMWMHLDTITWLAKTGEPYPEALHTVIEPHINAVRARLDDRQQVSAVGQSNCKQQRSPTGSDQPATKETPTTQSSTNNQPLNSCQQLPIPQRIKPPTRNMQPYSFNLNHDRNYMRLQEVFLDIAALTPVEEQTHGVPPHRSLPSEVQGPTITTNSHEQTPPDGAASSQEQESDDSSDWSFTPERIQDALERADLPALDLLQKCYVDQVATLESKLTRAKARLHLITERQQMLRRDATRNPHLDAFD